MKRRRFLHLSTLLPFAATVSRSAFARQTTTVPHWRNFELTTQVEIAEPAGQTQLWLPVPLANAGDYQRRSDLRWSAPGAHVALAKIPGYDVELLHVQWADAESVRPVQLVATISTCDRRTTHDAASRVNSDISASTAQTYLQPTRYLPTDGIVAETAERITRNHDGDIEKARALYNWVVENTSRDAKTRGCGTGDVGSMLAFGNLGGKCADINGLFVALARAAKIPARDAYGIRVADSNLGYRCLGKSGDVSKAQHCRAEFYAKGRGWIAVDPADVRKVMLEEVAGGLPADDPKVVSARALLFGSWEMNWIAYNHGHDVALPGSTRAAVPFLMYPNGETRNGRLDSLDPATFKYSISSREVEGLTG
ncbi:MAG: transglutaminase family protein [Rudaea sp.]|nr:transglutaminase family protein [Rudaea sp.]